MTTFALLARRFLGLEVSLERVPPSFARCWSLLGFDASAPTVRIEGATGEDLPS